MDGGSARSSARVPPGFSLEFQAEVPGNNKPDAKVDRSDPQTLLAAGGLYNALLVRGRIEPGQTVRVVVNRVFDFPGTLYWSGVPPKVAAEELTGPLAGAGLRAGPHDLEDALRGRVAADDARRHAQPHRGQGDAGRILPHQAMEWPLHRLRFGLLSLPMGRFAARSGSTPWT